MSNYAENHKIIETMETKERKHKPREWSQTKGDKSGQGEISQKYNTVVKQGQ